MTVIPAALAQPSGRLRDALEAWCVAGATGALRVLDPPGGSVYLTRGRVSFAETPPASGVDRLLMASGRLSAEEWRTALAAARAGRRGGDVLVQQGLLTAAELAATLVAAIHGAAHFLFDVETEVRFEMGAAHIFGHVVELDPAAVGAEVDRRRRLLAEVWPDSRVDTHAVVPVRRLPGHQVALTALQWEIVVNADRRRTPAELARSLGRDTFATLLEARRLARAGLVEPGRPRAGAPGDQPGTGERGVPAAPVAGRPWAVPAAAEPEPDDAVLGSPEATSRPVPAGERQPLPRRAVRTGARRAVGPEAPPPAGCPESTLVRIRDALEALR